MSAASSSAYLYTGQPKRLWRAWVRDRMLQRSFAVADNRLCGRWVEPVGTDAEAFRDHISSGVIDECQLIGIDGNPANPEASAQNIARCRRLFQEAEFVNTTWSDFCFSSDGAGIRYIVYDLFTSTYGSVLAANLDASCSLVAKALRSVDQVLLVANADFGRAQRQGLTVDDYGEFLRAILRRRRDLPEIDVDTGEMYTYRNTPSSSLMGSIVLDFH